MWDALSALRVGHFVANSDFVAQRINKLYRRDAEVIHPPVAVDDFEISPDIGGYYLILGQLVGHKRGDIAVEAFNRLGSKLVIVGGGEDLEHLQHLAGPNISVLGPQPFDKIRTYYSRCRALTFPGLEDFSIVPVEAMASGRPVIAYGKGGVIDTVKDGETGIYFNEQSPEALIAAVQQFEKLDDAFNPSASRAHATCFSIERFKAEMAELIADLQDSSRPDN